MMNVADTNQQTDTRKRLLQEANHLLRGADAVPTELFDLAMELKSQQAFGHARRLLEKANGLPLPDDGLRTRIRQKRALCTYKDPDLPTDERIKRALEILTDDGEIDLRTSEDQETLGLSGAIYKYMWDVDGRWDHLLDSSFFYSRGYSFGPEHDRGYTGINTAYVLDLMASLGSERTAIAEFDATAAQVRREEARKIREHLCDVLPKLLTEHGRKELAHDWWFMVTVAEAYFGLRDYDNARAWLEKATKIEGVPTWEQESTFRQLASLSWIQHSQDVADKKQSGEAAWQALTSVFGDHAIGAESAFRGKVGLALSGGGFRASLFHIGVLAKLAELDVLRHVEVLSCVSGGSILGAHYYLKLRALLEGREETEIIKRNCYIKLVEGLCQEFLDGVKMNIRSRIILHPGKTVKMILSPDYSRTHRLGELLERYFYKPVLKDDAKLRDHKRVWLSGLYITPMLEDGTRDEGFRPKHDNWRRRCKVPILVLNASALNTGHVWQFTASWMGEPPAGIDAEVDGNYRLRRMYYDDAPEPYRNFSLGDAVAASACVPGLFEPLELDGLYPGKVVRLVDGGVYDNQGIVSLLEQNCTVLLVSDASGQMDAKDEPSSKALNVLLRMNSILMARVRQEEYHRLSARLRGSLLRGLMFIHLKKGLHVDPVAWIGCDEPTEGSKSRAASDPMTDYGIPKSVQARLAAIRTDLDSFSDAEAFALMTSGYRMTEREFEHVGVGGFDSLRGQAEPSTYPWKFLEIEQQW